MLGLQESAKLLGLRLLRRLLHRRRGRKLPSRALLDLALFGVLGLQGLIGSEDVLEVKAKGGMLEELEAHRQVVAHVVLAVPPQAVQARLVDLAAVVVGLRGLSTQRLRYREHVVERVEAWELQGNEPVFGVCTSLGALALESLDEVLAELATAAGEYRLLLSSGWRCCSRKGGFGRGGKHSGGRRHDGGGNLRRGKKLHGRGRFGGRWRGCNRAVIFGGNGFGGSSVSGFRAG